MSTSLLYHGFGIVGYRYVRTRFEGGSITFTVRQDRTDLKCPVCGSREVIKKGRIWRRWRALPIGSKPVWITMAVQRIKCLICRLIRQVDVAFARQRKRYTKAFERYALELARHMSIQDVAQHLGVSWDVIKEIQKRYLKQRFARPSLKGLKRIAIDEISVGKGHRYLTLVLDLNTGAVVFIGDGKGSDALVPFWKRLRRSGTTIEAVAIDMSPAYIAAVMENLPDASIVFDHFHVIKMFNERLSDLRRKIYRHASEREQKVLKGSRWVLLKNPENLDESRNEPERLQQALDLNLPLTIAYYMKEDLRRFWSQPNKEAATSFLDDWIARARASNVLMLMKFANTLSGRRFGLLAYYDHPISTGPLEGTNNKIKTMKRQAYGFRDMEFFRLKIMALHESRYALVG